jgi:hypothetical protein
VMRSPTHFLKAIPALLSETGGVLGGVMVPE